MAGSCADLLGNNNTVYSLYSGNDVVLCAYRVKRTIKMRVVDSDRLLSIMSCRPRDEKTGKVTFRITHSGTDETFECRGISACICNTVADNWEPCVIEFGTYSICVSKQDLVHRVDEHITESIIALKVEIWCKDDTDPNRKISIVKGGAVSVPETVNFNQGTGQHKSTIVLVQKGYDNTPIFTLDYSITDSRHPDETVHIRGMMTQPIYRGIGLGSAIIDRFLGSFYLQTSIDLVAVSDSAERFWQSVGFDSTGSGLSEMPDMVGNGTNIVAYPTPPTMLNGMYTLKYDKDRSIHLMLEESVHVSGNPCRLCTTNPSGSTECTSMVCTHYMNTESDKLEFQYGDSTEELEFNRLDLRRSSYSMAS
jgi:hypothetical protein